MKSKYYQPAAKNPWRGRIDHPEDYDYFRWHQIVKGLDLSRQKESPVSGAEKGFCFLGFCGDEGVRRNLGRPGAAKGPLSIRKDLANLPCSFDRKIRLFDAGNILCPDRNMEKAQDELASAVRKIISLNLFPVVLGGGHEVAFGHYGGIEEAKRDFAKDKKFSIGIVNFDAHFDLRPYGRGGNSGTMFLQIADRCRENREKFSAFYIGIQKTANTLGLFKTAARLKASYVLAKDISDASLPDACGRLSDFIDEHDGIYLTICADVFSSAFAAGVSSPQPFGLLPETVLHLMKHVVRSGKVLSFDFAEVSPGLDPDHRTAKLAAVVVFAYINTVIETAGASPRAVFTHR
jgi:formiminoglutamase